LCSLERSSFDSCSYSEWLIRSTLKAGSSIATDVYGCPYYTIHEVYYTDGQPDSWTETPVYPMGNTIEELREELEQMLEAFTKPAIDFPE